MDTDTTATVEAADPGLTPGQLSPQQQAELDAIRAARAEAQERVDREGGIFAADADAEDDPAAAMRAAAKTAPNRLDDDTAADALDWFLSDDDASFTKAIKLNVGGPVDEDGKALNPKEPPKWIEWVVRPIDLDTIQTIRRQANRPGNRRQRRMPGASQGEFDEMLFNLGVVVEATVHPDVRVAAQRRGIADPRQALKLRFQRKSGLIGQIVGEVLDMSGYNENDVQDSSDAPSPSVAAGN